MENSREENAKGELLQSIHQMVQTVKHSREVSLEYMKVFEREKMIRDESVALKVISQSRKQYLRGVSAENCADMLIEEISFIRAIYKILAEHEDWTDEKILEVSNGPENTP